MGLRLELADVELEGLDPAGARSRAASRSSWSGLPELDAPMLRAARGRARAQAACCATSARSTPRRNARRSASSSSIASHPFANINLTDNVVRFVTGRYDRNPLVVQGPGAGPAVTAGGVFADLLRVCAYLGARL